MIFIAASFLIQWASFIFFQSRYLSVAQTALNHFSCQAYHIKDAFTRERSHSSELIDCLNQFTTNSRATNNSKLVLKDSPIFNFSTLIHEGYFLFKYWWNLSFTSNNSNITSPAIQINSEDNSFDYSTGLEREQKNLQLQISGLSYKILPLNYLSNFSSNQEFSKF